MLLFTLLCTPNKECLFELCLLVRMSFSFLFVSVNLYKRTKHPQRNVCIKIKLISVSYTHLVIARSDFTVSDHFSRIFHALLSPLDYIQTIVLEYACLPCVSHTWDLQFCLHRFILSRTDCNIRSFFMSSSKCVILRITKSFSSIFSRFCCC